jgi:hypothetical protein
MGRVVGKWWWSALFFAGIASTAALRLSSAGYPEPPSWTSTQSRETILARRANGIRYLCVDDAAFDLGQGAPPGWPGEDRLWIEPADLKNRCRPPGLPYIENTRTRLSATCPDNGYGAMLLQVNENRTHAVTGLKRTLVSAGWRETAGSRLFNQRHPAADVGWYTKGRAWLLILPFLPPGTSAPGLLLVGQWDPATMV